jgi:hypothetical protein
MNAVGSSGSRFARPERISLAIALAWGVGLVIAAFVAPVYQSSATSSSGAATAGSATLIGVNGWVGLLAAAAPLAAALVTGGALWRRAGRAGAGIAAWIVVGVLAGFNVLAMLSIGVFVLPVTIALVVACGWHGRQPRGVIARPGTAG